MDDDKPQRQKFKGHLRGYFDIDIVKVGAEESKLCVSVAIERITELSVAQLVEKASRRTGLRAPRASTGGGALQDAHDPERHPHPVGRALAQS
ncbi:hypothetical protein [Marivita sp. XM-24bin2]|jgi:hypothetical protein|uniref:hypothetical protein n=1 Tax=unclassified Marivita TaxID=2632480 RepID=UPI0025BA4C10|nr:hypothetical protein [Marivita sp. XM-24bin2]